MYKRPNTITYAHNCLTQQCIFTLTQTQLYRHTSQHTYTEAHRPHAAAEGVTRPCSAGVVAASGARGLERCGRGAMYNGR